MDVPVSALNIHHRHKQLPENDEDGTERESRYVVHHVRDDVVVFRATEDISNEAVGKNDNGSEDNRQDNSPHGRQ